MCIKTAFEAVILQFCHAGLGRTSVKTRAVMQTGNANLYLCPGTCYLVPGTWYLVPGTWYLVPGTRAVLQFKLLPGTWYLVPGRSCSLNWYWHLFWIILAYSNW